MLLRPALQLADYLGPVFAAIVFIVIMSQVKEPARHNYNAIFLAGASGVYMNGGLGLWELLYVAIAGGVVAYLALRSYYALGLGWLMHACWDLVHHLYGTPIWAFMPSSSFGCLLFDTLIAIWFMAGAPAFPRKQLGERPHL
jgi:hypothetical protein